MSDRTPSETFGRAYAAALGTGPSRSTLNAQRATLDGLVARYEHERRADLARRAAPWALGASAMAMAAAVALWMRFAPHAVQATLNGRSVAESAELAAPESQELSFSDGSAVVLAPAARAVLTHVASDRAELRLNEGHLSASIRKKTGITWTIGAGPYSVQVVGTRFSVDWQRASETLKVSVSEGRVRVFGGDLGAQGIALDAGASLERHHGSPVIAQRTPEPEPSSATVLPSEPATLDAPKNEPAPSLPNSAQALPNTARAEASTTTPNFLALAAKGKYRDALQAAEKQGFSDLVEKLPGNDLVTLANAARFSGNSARAHQALNALRQRFPGRAPAELAALYLARTAEDLDHKPAEAIRWLRVYLSESPRGDLAASARASLMDLLLRSGDTEGARSVARDYLRYHPTGPHAAEARALTNARR